MALLPTPQLKGLSHPPNCRIREAAQRSGLHQPCGSLHDAPPLTLVLRLRVVAHLANKLVTRIDEDRVGAAARGGGGTRRAGIWGRHTLVGADKGYS